ncbi:kinase-like protein [Thelephora ganbajun]|uniref:Kinase-like protein n=1 Tax=Thelephora ganbajun TaxID=370292 RepID=A0ACB6ZXD4_THEGA|nr:kinase-like protein [Thelephora ganbajun]
MNTDKGPHFATQTPLAISRTNAPVLSLDSAVVFSTPCHKENYDPFLVKSPQPPSCAEHVVTMTIPQSSSYDIEIGPGSSDEIEEIMVISPKKALPQISTLHDVFHLIAPLGSGVAAQIFLASRQNDSHDRLFAIKRMRKSLVLSDDFTHDPLSEQLILKTITSLDCPFLPRLYASFPDERYLYLVTDFCARGDLLTYLMRDGAFDSDATQFYASELVLAIDTLHQAGIVHRDLKPENVLIDISGHLIVTDFGCAKLIQPGASRWIETFCGTKEYLAPEMALEWAHDFSVDVWGFGILLYLLAFAQVRARHDDGCLSFLKKT